MQQALSQENTIREAVGVFNSAETLQAALDELQSHGFGRHQITVLADAETVEEKLGHIYRRVEEEEDDPDAPRTIFVPLESIGDAQGALIGTPLYIASAVATSIVVASGGTLLTAIAAATAAGAGGALFGIVMANLVEQHHADYISEQVQHGGLLLWVNVADASQQTKAVEILKKHSARDVHIHHLPAGE